MVNLSATDSPKFISCAPSSSRNWLWKRNTPARIKQQRKKRRSSSNNRQVISKLSRGVGPCGPCGQDVTPLRVAGCPSLDLLFLCGVCVCVSCWRQQQQQKKRRDKKKEQKKKLAAEEEDEEENQLIERLKKLSAQASDEDEEGGRLQFSFCFSDSC